MTLQRPRPPAPASASTSVPSPVDTTSHSKDVQIALANDGRWKGAGCEEPYADPTGKPEPVQALLDGRNLTRTGSISAQLNPFEHLHPHATNPDGAAVSRTPSMLASERATAMANGGVHAQLATVQPAYSGTTELTTLMQANAPSNSSSIASRLGWSLPPTSEDVKRVHSLAGAKQATPHLPTAAWHSPGSFTESHPVSSIHAGTTGPAASRNGLLPPRNATWPPDLARIGGVPPAQPLPGGLMIFSGGATRPGPEDKGRVLLAVSPQSSTVNTAAQAQPSTPVPPASASQAKHARVQRIQIQPLPVTATLGKHARLAVAPAPGQDHRRQSQLPLPQPSHGTGQQFAALGIAFGAGVNPNPLPSRTGSAQGGRPSAQPPIINTGNIGPMHVQPGDWVCSVCSFVNWRRRKVCMRCFPYADGNEKAAQIVSGAQIAAQLAAGVNPSPAELAALSVKSRDKSSLTHSRSQAHVADQVSTASTVVAQNQHDVRSLDDKSLLLMHGNSALSLPENGHSGLTGTAPASTINININGLSLDSGAASGTALRLVPPVLDRPERAFSPPSSKSSPAHPGTRRATIPISMHGSGGEPASHAPTWGYGFASVWASNPHVRGEEAARSARSASAHDAALYDNLRSIWSDAVTPGGQVGPGGEGPPEGPAA